MARANKNRSERHRIKRELAKFDISARSRGKSIARTTAERSLSLDDSSVQRLNSEAIRISDQNRETINNIFRQRSPNHGPAFGVGYRQSSRIGNGVRYPVIQQPKGQAEWDLFGDVVRKRDYTFGATQGEEFLRIPDKDKARAMSERVLAGVKDKASVLKRGSKSGRIQRPFTLGARSGAYGFGRAGGFDPNYALGDTPTYMAPMNLSEAKDVMRKVRDEGTYTNMYLDARPEKYSPQAVGYLSESYWKTRELGRANVARSFGEKARSMGLARQEFALGESIDVAAIDPLAGYRKDFGSAFSKKTIPQKGYLGSEASKMSLERARVMLAEEESQLLWRAVEKQIKPEQAYYMKMSALSDKGLIRNRFAAVDAIKGRVGTIESIADSVIDTPFDIADLMGGETSVGEEAITGLVGAGEGSGSGTIIEEYFRGLSPKKKAALQKRFAHLRASGIEGATPEDIQFLRETVKKARLAKDKSFSSGIKEEYANYDRWRAATKADKASSVKLSSGKVIKGQSWKNRNAILEELGISRELWERPFSEVMSKYQSGVGAIKTRVGLGGKGFGLKGTAGRLILKPGEIESLLADGRGLYSSALGMELGLMEPMADFKMSEILNAPFSKSIVEADLEHAMSNAGMSSKSQYLRGILEDKYGVNWDKLQKEIAKGRLTSNRATKYLEAESIFFQGGGATMGLDAQRGLIESNFEAQIRAQRQQMGKLGGRIAHYKRLEGDPEGLRRIFESSFGIEPAGIEAAKGTAQYKAMMTAKIYDDLGASAAEKRMALNKVVRPSDFSDITGRDILLERNVFSSSVPVEMTYSGKSLGFATSGEKGAMSSEFRDILSGRQGFAKLKNIRVGKDGTLIPEVQYSFLRNIPKEEMEQMAEKGASFGRYGWFEDAFTMDLESNIARDPYGFAEQQKTLQELYPQITGQELPLTKQQIKAMNRRVGGFKAARTRQGLAPRPLTIPGRGLTGASVIDTGPIFPEKIISKTEQSRRTLLDQIQGITEREVPESASRAEAIETLAFGSGQAPNQIEAAKIRNKEIESFMQGKVTKNREILARMEEQAGMLQAGFKERMRPPVGILQKISKNVSANRGKYGKIAAGVLAGYWLLAARSRSINSKAGMSPDEMSDSSLFGGSRDGSVEGSNESYGGNAYGGGGSARVMDPQSFQTRIRVSAGSNGDMDYDSFGNSMGQIISSNVGASRANVNVRVHDNSRVMSDYQIQRKIGQLI